LDHSTTAQTHPIRAMGLRDLIFFYVVTGVSLRWIATAASIGPSSLLMWLSAWLLFYVPLALSVIQLASRFLEEGGLYVWTTKAFGEGPGFLAAWIYWNSNLPYFPAVLYFAASNILFLRVGWSRYSHDSAYFVTFAVVALAVLTAINIVGLNVAKWSYNIGALAMWIPAAMVIVLGVVAWGRFGSATAFTAATLVPSHHLQDVVLWSTMVFAFGGCEAASMLGAEIKNPRRNVPVGLLAAGFTIFVCYVVGTLCVLLALPASETSNLDGLVQAVAKTAGRIGISGVTGIAAALIAISNIGAAAAFLAAAARLPFVAGIDGFLPPAFGKLHPRWQTPYISVLLQGVVGIAFVLIGQAGTSVKGAYDVLVDIGVITYLVPYLFLFAALIRLQRAPVEPGVIRLPGGTLVSIFVAVVGFVTASAAIVLSLIPPPDEPRRFLAATKIVGSSAILVAIGLAIYWVGSSRARRRVAVAGE
jgi:glutamate:GABA antiporter